ncbi:MAG TPA: hypothetical protein DCF33_16320 [Saprospirales bacterium]|nr:hypothetical protein [Saprospirales bacterium]
MKPILTRFFAGLFLLVAAQAFGQMTTSFVVTSPAPAPSYPIGTHLQVELRVNGFTNIESMQFPIAFNKVALRFDSLTNSVFSNWNAGNFIGNNGAGKIGISWDGYSNGANMPFTFPNGTALFKLHFTVINNGTSVININPSLAPPALDIVGNGQPVTLNYQNGGTPTITLGTGAPPPPPLVGFKIVANTIYIPPGQRACMPVTVNDFDNIVSMQWAMHWDNTVLNFECVRGFNLPGWSATDFNSTFSVGTLLAGWADPAGVGVTRADGVRIVDVCFKGVGAPGASSTITIDGIGFPPGNGSAEAYNSSSVNVWTASNHPNGASGVSAPVNIMAPPGSPFDVTYTVDTVSAAPNTQACVEVKVKNFTAITSAEFALGYTPAQLTFSNNDFGSNPLNLQASNLVHQVNPGVIKFQWSSANGASLADNTPIFKSCFTVIAAEGTTCPITFTTTPCPSITGFGTAKSTGGVAYANVAGWIKSATQGPTINIAQDISCNGGTNGSLTVVNPATLSATGYTWSGNAGTTQTVSNLGVGTYTVTVTYSNGTTATASRTLVAPPAISTTVNTTVVSCFGGNNGAIDLNVAGGTAPYTYNWGGGITIEDRANLTASIYTVTVTDAKGCTKTQTASVSGFIAIVATPTVTNISCAGLTNGAISLNVVGGAGNYSYAWNSMDVTKDISNKPAGSYIVTVTDGNNCTKVFSGPNFTITAPQAVAPALVSKTDVKCMNTPTGSATLNVTGGTGTMSYCWSSGPGPCASLVQNPTNLMPGTYTVIATDANGCTGTLNNITIANPPSALSVQGSTTPSPCFDQPSGSIISNGTGGWGTNYTYAWSGPVQLAPVSNHMPVPGGTYTVTVTDANQCTATSTLVVGGAPEITQNAAVTHVACFGVNNGAINLNLAGGNQPYQSVQWSNTTLLGQSISTLAPGSYQPTVTDAQGCTKIFQAITINGPQVLTIDTTIAEANPSNGSIDFQILSGGTPGFTYLWSNGATTQDISGLAAGTYTVTVTDANSCVRTFSFTVPNGNVLGITSVSSVKNSCAADGCINISIGQTAAAFTPITLNWGFGTMQTNSLTPSICDLSSGVYNITITASNGNSSVLTGVQVAQLDPASVNSNTTNPFSSINKNGKITLNKAPGVQCNLTYQWGPAPLNSTSNEVSNLGQGTYFVTITNPCSGCVNIQEYNLEYSPVGGISSVQNPMCAATEDGAISLNIQGGNLPYEYAWTGPNGFTSNVEDISGLAPGVYNVTVSDQDDRTFIQTFTLSAQSPLNITNVNETSLYGTFQVSGANTCDGAATLAFIPGIGTTNIQWSNGITTANNTTLCGGAYSVTLTDAQGCTATWVDELTAPAPIALTSTEAPILKCNGDCNGTARIKVGGGVGPYSVSWSTGQFDPLVTANGFSQAVNLCGGDYQVTVTDDNDVQQIFTVTVPEPAPIEATFASTAPRNFNSCDGDMLINLTGAVFPVTYVWSGNFGHTGDSERAEELCSGEFVEFLITDANGCTAYFSDSIPYPEDGCFRVSPIITPGQQDGKNDFVVITCIETAFENTMEIYNRWGQLVFETEDYTNNDADRDRNWNGLTSSGAVLAEGVYYYVLTFKYLDDQGITREGTRKGAINLLR